MEEKPAPKKRGRKPTLKEKDVAKEIAKRNGNLSAVARAFGVARASLQEFISNRPALQIVLSDARERMLDTAESALYKAVAKGEAWAVCFFLKTQGRSRGYDENETLREMQKEIRSLREIILARAANGSPGGTTGTPRTGGSGASG